MSNNFFVPRSPVVKFVTYVLSNGASLRMPVATEQAGPRFASFDIFNHNLWNHKLETDSSLEAAKNILPDMADYYAKFAKPASGGSSGGKQQQAGAASGRGRKGSSVSR